MVSLKTKYEGFPLIGGGCMGLNLCWTWLRSLPNCSYCIHTRSHYFRTARANDRPAVRVRSAINTQWLYSHPLPGAVAYGNRFDRSNNCYLETLVNNTRPGWNYSRAIKCVGNYANVTCWVHMASHVIVDSVRTFPGRISFHFKMEPPDEMKLFHC